MANPHRGQVTLDAGDVTYTLSFSVNALCELEELLDKPVGEIAAMVNDPATVRVATLRALLWGALRDHHPAVDLRGAGELASEVGMPACMAAVGRAFKLAFPEAPANARPRKAKASTPSAS